MHLKPTIHLAVLYADHGEFDRRRKSEAIFATDRYGHNLSIFFAGDNVGLQLWSQFPSNEPM